MNHADFLKEWELLKERLDRLERFPQPPTIINSNVASTSFTLAAGGSAGDMVLAYFNLNNVNTFRMLAVPRIQIFKNNSLLDADRWPLGANWTAAELRGLDIIPIVDQGISFSIDVNDLTALYQFRNRSAGAITGVNVYCDWRLQQLQGGT